MDKVLLTRPQEISQKTAQNFTTKNFHFIIDPLFSIIEYDDIQPIRQSIQAVLITSSSAIFALQKMLIDKETLILAVGGQTASRVREIGYQNIVSAQNSAKSLLDLSLKILLKNKGLILYLSGLNINLDLAFELQKIGFEAKRKIVYQTNESDGFSPETIQEIANGKILEVWIYSKNSIRIFYKLSIKHDLLKFFTTTTILCLTEEIADLAKEMGFIKTGIIKNEYARNNN